MIAKKYPRSTTVQNWIKSCIAIKIAKSTIRTSDFAGAAIPIGALGIATSIASNLAKIGIILKYGTLINFISMELHWRAFREMQLATLGRKAHKVGGPNGPASAVIFELFRRRGATKFFGQYNVFAMIK